MLIVTTEHNEAAQSPTNLPQGGIAKGSAGPAKPSGESETLRCDFVLDHNHIEVVQVYSQEFRKDVVGGFRLSLWRYGSGHADID